MKILMVLDHEFPSDIRVEKEMQTLVNAGHQVDLACLTLQKRIKEERAENYTIYRKPISVFTYKTAVGALKFSFYFNFWQKWLSHLLKTNTYNAIHIHDLPLAKVGYNLSKKFKIKFVLDLHENWPVLMDLSPHTKSILGKLLHSNKQWLAYEKKMATHADSLIVVADEMKNRLLKRGVVNKSIYIVPNTTDIDIFDPYKNVKPDPKYFTLLYTGGINKHRGIELVIDGLKKIKLQDNFRFWVVGFGKNEPALKKMVADYGLERYVHFFGRKTQQEVYEITMKSDIAIIPHLKTEHSDNTSPNKIFHYMLAKKPILATNCNYIENILNETNSGLTFENENIADFIEKIEFMTNNPNKCEVWGLNGNKAVLNFYNWENTSKELVELYKK